ncbi:unnamed protein product, partial [Symbiodinium pilosum]
TQQEHQLFRLAENCLWEQFTTEGRRTNSGICRYIADLREATEGLLWNDLFVHLKGKLAGPHREDFVRRAADILHLRSPPSSSSSSSSTATSDTVNLDVVEYPVWDELPGGTRRDWALFFGQDIAAREVLNPPMQILAEFQEDIPMGMQREFPLGQRRVCPDVCGRQTCRRPHCECIHPDFVDHAWVPLNCPCRNFFRGHCTKEGGCPNLHADTFPEAVYAAFRQLTLKRPSTRLHYVQHRGIFRFITRSEAMDMIMTSLTTSDTMAIKQFIMGMSWTKFPTGWLRAAQQPNTLPDTDDIEIPITEAEPFTVSYTNVVSATTDGYIVGIHLGFGTIVLRTTGATAERSASATATSEGHAQGSTGTPGRSEAHTRSTARRVTHGQIYATGNRGHRSSGGCIPATAQSQGSASPSDEDTPPVEGARHCGWVLVVVTALGGVAARLERLLATTAPQQPSTEYSVWDDTWPTQQYQHHRRFHRHGLPARAAIVRNMLTPVPAIAPDNVAQFPPSNYPYMAFAPWFVNTSMLQAVEFALVGFNNPESCYLILRDYMALAVHVRRFTQDRPSVERYIMAFTDAVLDCVCFMLPMAWRSRFTDDWAQVVTVSGQPTSTSLAPWHVSAHS